MLLACVYIVAVGAGLWSIDALLARRRWEGALLQKVRDDAPRARRVIVMSAQPDTSETLSDGDLVARMGQGDERALRTLHRRYAALVFTVATRVVDAAAAEEIVQDVFMTLWRKHEAFDPARGALKPWLCQVTRRRALNVRRSRGRSPDEGGDGIEDVADDALQADEALWSAHRRSCCGRSAPRGAAARALARVLRRADAGAGRRRASGAPRHHEDTHPARNAPARARGRRAARRGSRPVRMASQGDRRGARGTSRSAR